MDSDNATTQVVYAQRERSIDTSVFKSGYEVDFWQEVKKRWMVLGVLLAMALAVLAPQFGAPGGNYMHAHVDIPRTHCTHSPM
ncbi:jg10179 [Pararge aegeria aegeria]|uniref:Jg10179 protein n=1 Tax=Pararge aegeria aegeria TaxID=348720 RepID=A0A8S4S6L3_9NEOP|nr:jg10179 [Pararge aegeria aegeria]